MQLQCWLVCCALEDLLRTLLPLRISKPYLVQAGTSTRVANHTRAWTHTCKNGGYHYFKRLCPVVISNSNPLSEFWHKYPTFKLSSMSRSTTLILAQIIKNNFNNSNSGNFNSFFNKLIF